MDPAWRLDRPLGKLRTETVSPGVRRGSLRGELLFNLGFLALAALLLAGWTATMLRVPGLSEGDWTTLLVVLIAADVAVFIGLGAYLIQRLVVRPLADVADVAQAIAGGDYARRAPVAGTRETAAVASALNAVTDQLLQDRAGLAENVRSLDRTNRLLVAAQRDLIQAEKLASIGRLAAGVAHEVGNPLGALLGYLTVLRRRGGDAELLDGMDREAKRIDRIVRGLLDYARPHGAVREPTDVNASAVRVLELLRSQGRLRGVAVRFELEPDLPAVAAATHPMDQVFVNLLANADDAMGGAGTLVVSTRQERFAPAQPIQPRREDDPPEVDYSHLRRARRIGRRDPDRLEAGDQIVRIVVEDDGPGLPEGGAELIWDPFYTTKAPGQGTGLGLAIVASTVAELRGQISADAGPLGGARFTISLPIYQAEL